MKQRLGTDGNDKVSERGRSRCPYKMSMSLLTIEHNGNMCKGEHL